MLYCFEVNVDSAYFVYNVEISSLGNFVVIFNFEGGEGGTTFQYIKRTCWRRFSCFNNILFQIYNVKGVSKTYVIRNFSYIRFKSCILQSQIFLLICVYKFSSYFYFLLNYWNQASNNSNFILNNTSSRSLDPLFSSNEQVVMR